jgi:hypothetical protein
MNLLSQLLSQTPALQAFINFEGERVGKLNADFLRKPSKEESIQRAELSFEVIKARMSQEDVTNATNFLQIVRETKCAATRVAYATNLCGMVENSSLDKKSRTAVMNAIYKIAVMNAICKIAAKA